MMRVRDYFKGITSVLRADGTIGGIRFRKGDKPTEDVFKDLRESHPMFLESNDRAKVTTGGSIGDEVGLVALANNTQAKANAVQLSDRSIVVQPHQLPTLEQTPNDFTVTTVPADGASTSTQVVFDIVPDGTNLTRNKYIAKLSVPFTKWLLRRVVPAGGTATQVLSKNSGTDYDYSWTTPAGGTPPDLVRIVYANTVQTGTVVVTGTTVDLLPYTIPANLLKTNGDILEYYIRINIDHSTTTNNWTFVYFNGSLVYTYNSGILGLAPRRLDIRITRLSNTSISIMVNDDATNSVIVSSLNLTSLPYIIKLSYGNAAVSQYSTVFAVAKYYPNNS